MFHIGPKPKVWRASCDDCRYVGPPRAVKEEARVDLQHHRRARHNEGPVDPRDEPWPA